MALLTSCLSSRVVGGAPETNLLSGKIYVYGEGTQQANLWCGFCWISPGTGTAKIEIWGAGGSSSRMCCCGFGLPGNAGAYSSRTVNVISGCYICGCIGRACNNPSSLCERGCSDPTMLCWFGSGTNGCMCAQGGRSGISICSSSPSAWCCFLGNSFCGCCQGPGCGIICNIQSGSWIACGYGGTVNCCGGFSCSMFSGCDDTLSANSCCRTNYTAAASGTFATFGGVAVSASECNNLSSMATGPAWYATMGALNGLSRSPGISAPTVRCWTGSRVCACYESMGCIQYSPYGMGGAAISICSESRDNGWRGGMGLVKITYNGTGI